MLRVCPLIAALAFVGLACSSKTPSFLVAREPDPLLDRMITQLWADDIRERAQDGDWLLSRSYYFVADFLGTVVPGVPLSHAAVYDAERGSIVETVEVGTRELSLEEFLQRNHYAFLVRPKELTQTARRAGLYHARGLSAGPGGAFDIVGMLGFDVTDEFYCSEIAYWSAGYGKRRSDHWIITPAGLLQRADLIYATGPRNREATRTRALAALRSGNSAANRAASPWPSLVQLPSRRPVTSSSAVSAAPYARP